MKVVYPGSFDPITLGHLDIIQRASSKFDEVVVLILNNPSKKVMFDVSQRISFIEEAIKNYDNVIVDSYDGLLVEYLRINRIDSIVKGLRAFTDFEYEFQMALMNHYLEPDMETFFLMTSNKYSFVSSSMVKEASKFGADISALVPKHVNEAIISKIRGDNQ